MGDTIDKLEKLDYSLFPKIDNDAFQEARIRFENEKFYLEVTDTANNLIKVAVEREELIEAQQNIEKINEYYRLAEKQKQREEEYPTTSAPKKKYPIRMEGPMSEQMRKEARMHNRLKEDARRRAEFENRIFQNSLYLEFK